MDTRGGYVLVLRSTMFLVAVAGLLCPPPPLPPPKPFTALAKTSGRRVSTTIATNAIFGNFDAGAWKDIAVDFDEPGAKASSSEVTKSPRDGDELELFDVEVEKLPTFVFFYSGDGGVGGRQPRVRRMDVVGGRNAGACRAQLEAKLALLSGTTTTTSLAPTKTVTADGKGNIEIDGRDANGDDSGDVGLDINIVDVGSIEDLRGIVNARHRRAERGPVVVMYHAPWCRKCSYLTPMFRRLARRYSLNNASKVKAPGGRTGSDGPRFYRVDVSTWGGRYASTASGAGKAVGDGGKYNAVATPRIPDTALDRSGNAGLKKIGADDVDEVLHEGSPAMEDCLVCGKSGFVPCGECNGKGAVVRKSSDGKHRMAVTCPACVGYKRLRCPACGGKCYMCD